MPVHPRRHGHWLRLARLGSILMLQAAALCGLVSVGLGEAYRGYARLQFKRLADQGTIIKEPVELLLRVGVSLEQFTGFTNLASAVRAADPLLEEIRILDAWGRVLFCEPCSREPLETGAAPASPSELSSPKQHFGVLEDAHAFRVSLPLEDRFEPVGRLELVLPKAPIHERVIQHFQPIFTALGACILLTAILLPATQRLWLRRQRLWLGLAFSATFLGLTLFTLHALETLYSDGLQQGTSSLAHSLARRLNEAARIGLTLADLRGLDTLLQNYQRTNADLGSLSLIADEHVLIGSGAPPASSRRGFSPQRFEYAIDLELTGGPPRNTPVRLEVGAATNALPLRLWQSLRNFLMLFLASGVVGALLLKAFSPVPRPGLRRQSFERHAVDRLRPLAFLGCFMEGLHLAFLPSYIERLAAAQGHPPGGAALLATAFCLAYVLALPLGERYARARGIKPLLLAALLASAAPVCLMAFTQDLRLLLAVRCLSGVGLAALSSSIHGYLQAVFGPEHPPREASLLTSARHTGLFSGAAIGALVAAHQGPRQALLLAGLAGLLAMIYALALLPPLEAPSEPTPLQPRFGPPSRRIRLTRTWRAPGFLSATLLVGMPTLLLRKGVIAFALPLLLAHQGRDLDRIGQILAVYALGVLLSHHLLTTHPVRDIPQRRLLQAGMAGSGLGLLALGFVDSPPALGAWMNQGTLCALAVGVLGLSHGLIHEPLERHLLLSQGEPLGTSPSLSFYRLINGLGQCLGPMLVSVLLLASPNRFQQLGWLGVMALTLAAGLSLASRHLPGHEVRRA